MKFIPLFILLFLFAQAPAAAQSDARRQSDEREGSDVVSRVSASRNVVVSVCLSAGNVIVRGWDREEVRARAEAPGSIRLQATGEQPAVRVEVLAAPHKDARIDLSECGMIDSLELSVPHGATVNVQARSGDVEVSDVAEARVESLSGDVNLSGTTRAAEVNSMSGDVTLAGGRGRVRLRTVSGTVEAIDVRKLDESDLLEIASTSGDVIIERANFSQIRASAISGGVRMTGSLARGGSYEFKTISGDVTLTLPADSSFKLNANVVMSGEIITDFPVKTATAEQNGAIVGGPASQGEGKRVRSGQPLQTRLVGTVGGGDADLRLTSFNGTLHLKKN